MKVWQQKEAIATSEAHELLELRSMGVRSALQANEMANARISAGEWKPNQPAQPPTQRELRAAELHKKLGIDKVQLVTSPLHIDDTPQAGHNTAFQWMPEAGSGSFAPPDGLDPMAQAPGPAATTKRAPMRGGAWPVNDNYFEYKKPPPSPKAVKKEDQNGHNMGVPSRRPRRARRHPRVRVRSVLFAVGVGIGRRSGGCRCGERACSGWTGCRGVGCGRVSF